MPIDNQMIQIRAEFDGVSNCIISDAIDAMVETGVYARIITAAATATTTATVSFNNSCGPDDAVAVCDYGYYYYCCCQQ